MKYTDTQLKIALAKMLPDELTLEGTVLLWRVPRHGGWHVDDSQLLHLCWLVEETFTHKSNYVGKYGEIPIEYFIALRDVCYETKHSGISIELAMLHATWQQRTIALAKVKGIEI